MNHTTENKLKRIFAISVMLFALIVRTSFSYVVLAEEVPVDQTQTTTTEPTPTQEQPQTASETQATPTPAETTPAASPTPPAQESVAPSTPEAPSAPSTPSTPTNTQTTNPAITQDQMALHEQKAREQRERRAAEENQSNNTTSNQPSASVTSTSAPSAVVGTHANGNVGDTTVTTGNASNSANITNQANSNLSVSPSRSGTGATVANTGNGSGSTNTGVVSGTNNSSTNQDNNANVLNNLVQNTTTGYNSASENVGDSSLKSGDANTSGTIFNYLNTNVDGVMVAEFNVTDDHMGDLVLDFAANCIIGCGTENTSATNSGNGADSTNNATINDLNNSETFQNNDASVENNMFLTSKSGHNEASKNTGGDTTLESGDANVSANVLNFANNNIDGNVIYAVVNVYGNLVGDIIMPDPNTLNGCCGGDSSVTNSGNGADSSNTANLNQTNNTDVNQFNNADIENNLNYDANTGGNSVDKSTGGDVTVDTGDTSLIAQTVNVANMNLIGGNYWLVLVNEAGKWIGNIVGAEGSNVAGSETLEFVVGDDGQIAVVNKENGADSTNTASVNQENNSTTTQTNDAKIVNNINLVADTGHNDASKNTGGDTTVKTGDAEIVANIVNFVNNNIVGNGKLFVTVVNVFGSWIGDFVGPGQTKQTNIAQNAGVGGASNQQNAQVTPTQAPVAQVAASAKKLASKVLGTGTTTISSTGNGENSLTTEEKVSEELTDESNAPAYEVQGARAERPQVNINLAWALLGIPVFAGYLIARKRKTSASSAIK